MVSAVMPRRIHCTEAACCCTRRTFHLSLHLSVRWAPVWTVQKTAELIVNRLGGQTFMGPRNRVSAG